MGRVLDSPVLFVILAFVYPAAFLLAQNSHVYLPVQSAATLALVLLVACCGGALAWLLSRLARPALYRGILAAAGTAVMVTLLYSPIAGLVRDRALLVALYVLATVAAGGLGFFFSLRTANVMLALLILFNGGAAVAEAFEQGDPATREDAASPLETVEFQRTPNVYVVVLESYNSLDVRRALYGIDNTPLAGTLAELRFTVYDRAYANYWATVFSLSSMFSMQHHYYAGSVDAADGGRHRQIIGGALPNPVLSAFARNGYTIDYSQFYSAVYHPGPLLDRFEPQPALQPLELFPGAYSVVYRLTGWDMWHSPAFQRFLRLPDGMVMPAPDSAAGPAGRPVFSLLYTGAEHTGQSVAEEAWIDAYRRIVGRSDAVLIDLLRRLQRDDPAAIVVLVGDHGAWLHRDRWKGPAGDPNRNMLERGLAPAEVTRDLFEVFLAVKWPDGTQPPAQVSSPVNLFRELFAVLSGDEGVRGAPAADDSFAYVLVSDALTATPQVYRTVRDGAVLDRWESFEVGR